MTRLKKQQSHYIKVAAAITYLQENHLTQPSLATLSKVVGLSESHLQRVFSEWVGLSPKQFLQFLSKAKAKALLKEHSINQSAWESGLSGGSRLYDLMIKVESVTPGEYKLGGKGLNLEYGIHASPFGLCFIGLSPRGLCKLAFFDHEGQAKDYILEFEKAWPQANITGSSTKTEDYINQIFLPERKHQQPLTLVLKGTPFQLQVWEALLRIPPAALYSYHDVAVSIDKPKATRAVASAIAKNNLGFLIPCHRVIRNNGVISQYRWGSTRKAALIGYELAQASRH